MIKRFSFHSFIQQPLIECLQRARHKDAMMKKKTFFALAGLQVYWCAMQQCESFKEKGWLAAQIGTNNAAKF